MDQAFARRLLTSASLIVPPSCWVLLTMYSSTVDKRVLISDPWPKRKSCRNRVTRRRIVSSGKRLESIEEERDNRIEVMALARTVGERGNCRALRIFRCVLSIF